MLATPFQLLTNPKQACICKPKAEVEINKTKYLVASHIASYPKQKVPRNYLFLPLTVSPAVFHQDWLDPLSVLPTPG